MSDDHAANAISAYGSRLAEDAPTPNLDRIANEGVRLENCFCTNSICTPSRASILTGQHSHINGVKTLADTLRDDTTILPELLRAEGYQTAIFGKWHLPMVPRGFDEWAVLPGQGLYNDPYFVYPDGTEITDGVVVEDPSTASSYSPQDIDDYAFGTLARHTGYVTDIVTDKTLAWLEKRDANRPFFLCCHHKAPHDFFEYHHKHEHIFNDVTFAEPETLFETKEGQQEISRRYGSTVSERWEKRNMVKHLMAEKYPNGGPVDFSGLDFEGRARKAYDKYMRDYLRTVRSIDENVGRLLDYLDVNGLAENTIVVYTSDQGMMLGEHDHIDKRWIFDESQQMPLLIRYPAELAAGQVNRDMIDNTDFAPTLLDFAGASAPDWMQGRSFRPNLSGATPSTWRQSVYYRYWMHMAHHSVPAHYGIRTDKYKLVFFYGLKLDATGCDQGESDIPIEPGFELYDVENDPLETTNLIGDPGHAAAAASLKRALLAMKSECGDDDADYPELLELQRHFF